MASAGGEEAKEGDEGDDVEAYCPQRAILSKTLSRGTFGPIAAKVRSLNLEKENKAITTRVKENAATEAWIAEQRTGPPPGHAEVGTAIGLDIDSIGYTLAGTFMTAGDVCALGCTCSNLAEVVRGADFVWRALIETTFGGAYNESVARQMSASPMPSTIRFADGNPGATPTPDAPGPPTATP